MNRAKSNVLILGLLILYQHTAVAREEPSEQPEMELLEFLGGGEMIDGEWLDPLYMVDLEQQDLQIKQQEEKDNE